MSYSTYQKRLKYIVELLEKQVPITPTGLAKKFECCPKIIERMIYQLRQEGNNVAWCRSQKCYVLSDRNNLRGEKITD